MPTGKRLEDLSSYHSPQHIYPEDPSLHHSEIPSIHFGEFSSFRDLGGLGMGVSEENATQNTMVGTMNVIQIERYWRMERGSDQLFPYAKDTLNTLLRLVDAQVYIYIYIYYRRKD